MTKRFFQALLVFSVVLFTVSYATAHCEIPCGIYDDEMRFGMMAEHITTIEKSIKQIIELETGKIARQADAAIVVRMGGSIVLCTVTYSKRLREGIDFFPLTVNYLEKYYAAGRFPGGFMKREGKPSDRPIYKP